MARKPEDTLPKNKPKRTGKKGIGPALDPHDPDEKALAKLESPAPKGSLLVEQPPKPKVVGKRFEVFYDKPYFSKSPSGQLLVALGFSVVLEKEHKELIPKIVADGYHDILKKGRKGMTLRSIPGQAVGVYLSADSKAEVLVLSAAKVINASLNIVQRKGEGVARKVIRFTFRLQVLLPKDAKTDEVSHFAERNLQANFWMDMEESQVKLFDEEGDDADKEE